MFYDNCKHCGYPFSKNPIFGLQEKIAHLNTKQCNKLQKEQEKEKKSQ